MRSSIALPVSQMACKLSVFDEQRVIDRIEHMFAYKFRFLLARLFFESLEHKVSAKRIRETLNKLRKCAQEKESKLALLRLAYDDVMERINGQPADYKELANHVLSWIICAKRPLKTIEVQYAWAVKDSEDGIDEAAIPEAENMVSVCCGLVVIDKESEIIRLVHYTLQEYFQHTLTRWFTDPHHDIANTCVSYLLFKDFSDGPVRTIKEARERLEKPLFSYSVDYWGHHASVCSACIPRLLNLLTNPGWVSMVVQLCARFSKIRQPRFFYDERLSSEYLKPSQNVFHLVALYGLNNLVKELLTIAQDIDPDQRDNEGRTPLSYAAEDGHTEVVKTLLREGRVDAERHDKFGQTALSLAASQGHTEVVKTLLREGRVDAERRDKIGLTALSLAAFRGHTEVVKTLLREGRVDAERRDNFGLTALSLAAENGHTEVVKTLLREGKVDAERQDKFGQTALSLAALRGHTEVVKTLLREGKVDAERQDKFGQTALSMAAFRGHTEVVKILLREGKVDAERQDKFGQTALSLAALRGHTEVVKILSSDGLVEPDRQDNQG
jgi:FOG: Ankyrin repeat